jgi:hypothetical protein
MSPENRGFMAEDDRIDSADGAVIQQELCAKFDPINTVTLDPNRVDPFTKSILSDLSGPPTRRALLGQAALRAIAVFDDDGVGARGGDMVGWLCTLGGTRPIPEMVIDFFVKRAIEQSGFVGSDVAVVKKSDERLEIQILDEEIDDA